MIMKFAIQHDCSYGTHVSPVYTDQHIKMCQMDEQMIKK